MSLVMRPTIKLSAEFTAYDGTTGEKLWTKGKNSCTVLTRSRMTMLWQLFFFGNAFYNDTSGYEQHQKYRCKPFQYIQLGDGTENLDPWYDDLVHPLIEDGQTYGYTKYHDCVDCLAPPIPRDYGEPWKEGSWRLSDFQDFREWDADTTVVTWWQWYHFGTEHAADSTITEWGIFTTTKHEVECPPDSTLGYSTYCEIRRYLNRNHLDPDEQFYKDTNMIIRAMVRIDIGF